MNVIHELIHLTSLAQIGQDKLAMKVAQKLVENQNDVINQIMKLDDGGMIPDSKARNAAVRIMYYIAKGGKVKLEELNNVNTGNTQGWHD
jgi:hypothetical protein